MREQRRTLPKMMTSNFPVQTTHSNKSGVDRCIPSCFIYICDQLCTNKTSLQIAVLSNIGSGEGLPAASVKQNPAIERSKPWKRTQIFRRSSERSTWQSVTSFEQRLTPQHMVHWGFVPLCCVEEKEIHRSRSYRWNCSVIKPGVVGISASTINWTPGQSGVGG